MVLVTSLLALMWLWQLWKLWDSKVAAARAGDGIAAVASADGEGLSVLPEEACQPV